MSLIKFSSFLEFFKLWLSLHPDHFDPFGQIEISKCDQLTFPPSRRSIWKDSEEEAIVWRHTFCLCLLIRLSLSLSFNWRVSEPDDDRQWRREHCLWSHFLEKMFSRGRSGGWGPRENKGILYSLLSTELLNFWTFELLNGKKLWYRLGFVPKTSGVPQPGFHCNWN